MKRLFKQAMFHVEAHLKKFDKLWSPNGFSSIKAQNIIIVLKNILDYQDEVISLANRRIIKEENIDSKEKY